LFFLAAAPNEKALEELAATFKTQGVLEPLLVRELEERNYQVVIGARRLRAAKIAELDAVPVRVVKLTDAEAIEAQVVGYNDKRTIAVPASAIWSKNQTAPRRARMEFHLSCRA
jgi:ParB family chromosome partitioning protein